MEINLQKIIKKQKKLDEIIEENHNFKSKDIIWKKKLALVVELCELCNESKPFKYWSNKKSSEKSIIIDEFVDVLHFVISIGIFYKFKTTKFRINEDKDNFMDSEELTRYFLKLILIAPNINSSRKVYSFIKLYMILGNVLGFSFEEIEKAYYKKNEINIQRQKENY